MDQKETVKLLVRIVDVKRCIIFNYAELSKKKSLLLLQIYLTKKLFRKARWILEIEKDIFRTVKVQKLYNSLNDFNFAVKS